MGREWRSNLWMIIELLIVSLVLWFLFTWLCTLFNVRMRHDGYDFTNVYVSAPGFIKKDSQFFKPYDDSTHSYKTDYDLLIANLRTNPHVEILGTGSNALPYNYNYYGCQLHLNDSVSIYGNARYVTPEIIKLMKLEGLNGETPEQLADIIDKGQILIAPPDKDYSENPVDYKSFVEKFKIFVGKDVSRSNEMTDLMRVGAIAAGLRRADYEPLSSCVFYMPVGSNDMPDNIAFRIRQGHDKEFLESLTPADNKVGNVYISHPVSIDSMRDNAHVDYNTTIRNFLVCAVFLLLVIFLGFLGTFWFRTQQRAGEIAVRLVNGATPADIFRRFLGEGMIMLCIATLIAVPVEIVVVHYGLISVVEDLSLNDIEVYESMAVTFVLLVLLIVAGIWFPARKAMKINPAYALKDQ